jgi:hypothetical protein
MPHGRCLPVVAGAALAGALVLAPPARAGGASDLCARFAEVEAMGTVADPALEEISGIAASRRHEGIIWAEEDSGNDAAIHALSPQGELLGTYQIEGAEAVDWEDLASGPGVDPAQPALYVGDIGDNGADRPSVTIYRVAEPEAPPSGAGGTLPLLDRTEVTYPDGPVDAESLLVDPASGDVIVITKALLGPSQVLRVPSDALGAGAAVEAEVVGELEVPSELALGAGLPGTAVTSADIAPDGSFVLVRTYQALLAYPRAADQSVAEALAGDPCSAPVAQETQGEAVAVAPLGDAYLTVGEQVGAAVNRVAVAPAPTSVEGGDAGGDSDSSNVLPVVVGVAVAAALIGIAIVLVRRWSRPGD